MLHRVRLEHRRGREAPERGRVEEAQLAQVARGLEDLVQLVRDHAPPAHGLDDRRGLVGPARPRGERGAAARPAAERGVDHLGVRARGAQEGQGREDGVDVEEVVHGEPAHVAALDEPDAARAAGREELVHLGLPLRHQVDRDEHEGAAGRVEVAARRGGGRRGRREHEAQRRGGFAHAGPVGAHASHEPGLSPAGVVREGFRLRVQAPRGRDAQVALVLEGVGHLGLGRAHPHHRGDLVLVEGTLALVPRRARWEQGGGPRGRRHARHRHAGVPPHPAREGDDPLLGVQAAAGQLRVRDRHVHDEVQLVHAPVAHVCVDAHGAAVDVHDLAQRFGRIHRVERRGREGAVRVRPHLHGGDGEVDGAERAPAGLTAGRSLRERQHDFPHVMVGGAEKSARCTAAGTAAAAPSTELRRSSRFAPQGRGRGGGRRGTSTAIACAWRTRTGRARSRTWCNGRWEAWRTERRRVARIGRRRTGRGLERRKAGAAGEAPAFPRGCGSAACGVGVRVLRHKKNYCHARA